MDLLFDNLKGSENNWLQFRLTGRQSNRSAIGARIGCVARDLSQIREVQGGSGYNSMNPFRQHFGFGQRTTVDSVIIRWPSGMVDVLTAVPVNQIIDVTEGSATGITTRYVMPDHMNIQGNYPNPFNAQTVIRFALPELRRVHLTIEDISGRRVRTLIDDRWLSGDRRFAGLITLRMFWRHERMDSVEVVQNGTGDREFPLEPIKKLQTWRVAGLQGPFSMPVPLRIKLIGSDDPDSLHKPILSGRVCDADAMSVQSAVIHVFPAKKDWALRLRHAATAKASLSEP